MKQRTNKKVEKLIERIQAGDFKSKLYCPPPPIFGDSLDQMGHRIAYRKDFERLMDLFTGKALRAVGLEKHKKGKEAFEKAWEDHYDYSDPSSLVSVLYDLLDLAYLMKK